jgi:hypothetical protein
MSHDSQVPSSGLKWYHVVLFLLFGPLFFIALPLDKLGVDFFPLHWAGRRLLGGELPYGPDATNALAQVWEAPFEAAGIAYPLPLLTVVLPLAPLPFPVANLIWTAAGFFLLALVIYRAASPVEGVLLLLMFLPVSRAVGYGQATLIWCGLIALLLLAMQRRWWVIAGLCIVLLPLKPQTGLLFAVAGAVWAWNTERRALLLAGGVGAVLGAVYWAVWPTWLIQWVEHLARYSTVVSPQLVLPWGLVLVAATWRLPWWARLAALQFVLFPVSDLYSALMVLFCWVAVGGLPALLGAGVSVLWLILGLPNTTAVLWLLIIGPLALIAGWRSWQPEVKHLYQRHIRHTPV